MLSMIIIFFIGTALGFLITSLIVEIIKESFSNIKYDTILIATMISSVVIGFIFSICFAYIL